MHLFRYKMDHDFGLAPNPFGGIITLAVCKGDIRRNKELQIGDWIIGTGSVKMGRLNQLIYAMKVEGIITFDEYWNDPRFAFKKPVLNGSLVQLYGDNFYHTDPNTGEIIQELSAHSNRDNTKNENHTRRDVRGKNVLYSTCFYYFGSNSPKIPRNLQHICCTSRNYSYKDVSEDSINSFIFWLESNFEKGINGDPCNWSAFNLPNMEYYED